MTEFWLKIDYKGEDTGKVLTSVYDKVFHNELDSIQEIKITPCEKAIFIYANHDLKSVLGCIYEDTQIESPDKDLITSIRVGMVGE